MRVRDSEDVLAGCALSGESIGEVPALFCKVQTEKARLCIISVRWSIFSSFWDGVPEIRGAVDTIRTWNTESESLEGPENGLSS